MSYTIDEGIDDETRRLRAMQAVAKRYPEATRRNGRWSAPHVAEDATAVTVLNDDERERGDDVLAAVVEIEGMYVFDHWALMSVSAMLYTLKKEHPEAYAKVVDVVAGRKAKTADGAK